MEEERSSPLAVVVPPVWKARFTGPGGRALQFYITAALLAPDMLGKRAAAHDLQSAYGFISTFNWNFSSTQLSATALCLSTIKIFEISFHAFNCVLSINQIPFWQRHAYPDHYMANPRRQYAVVHSRTANWWHSRSGSFLHQKLSTRLSSREEESSRNAASPLTREAKLSMPTPIRIILPLIRGGIHSTVRCTYTYMILTKQLNTYTSNKN